MKKSAQTQLTYGFIIIYIAILFYVIIARIILNLIRGPSEQTPIEIFTAIILFIILILAINIFWFLKDKVEKHDKIIWLLAVLFFLIFFLRECNVRLFHWSPIDIIGFAFLLIVTRRIWQLEKYSGYLCILAILVLLVGIGMDNILDLKLLSGQELIRQIGIIEESSELFSALLLLQAFINLTLSNLRTIKKHTKMLNQRPMDPH